MPSCASSVGLSVQEYLSVGLYVCVGVCVCVYSGCFGGVRTLCLQVCVYIYICTRVTEFGICV